MPFENLIDQIENCCDIAEAGGQPFTAQQLVNTAYTLVFNTGLYFDDCKTWVHHPIAEKTWDNFKSHFLEAQQNLQMQQHMTQQASFHGANTMMNQENHHQMAEALANLVTATALDWQAFQTLVETNQNLATQLKTAQDEVMALKNVLKGRKPPGREWLKPDPNGYCWMHGYHVSIGHSSKTCKTKVVGHQDDATRANNMGGTQYGRCHGQSMVMTTSDEFTNYSDTSQLQIPPHPLDRHPAIMDTGTTGHFLLCNAPCLNKCPSTSPIQCQLPDGNHMTSTHQAELNIPESTLPKEALMAHLFPDLSAHLLISIRTFCDHGCHALFTAHDVLIIKDSKMILQGYHNPNRLWLMDLHKPGSTTAVASPKSLHIFPCINFKP